MQTFILALHVLACLILIVIVLLQSGKEGMGVIFGGGSGTVFGSSGAGGLLTKLTAILAAVFLITSLTYNILTSDKTAGEKSRILDVQTQETMEETVPLPESIPIEEHEAGMDQPESKAAAPEAQSSPKSGDEEILIEEKGAEPAKE